MPVAYKNNHYVPIWYQKRFVPDPLTQHKLFYLDLNPPWFFDRKNNIHVPNPVAKLGYKSCFAKDDLYTANINGIDHRTIEKKFFGAIDRLGREAVEWCSQFTYPWDGSNHIRNLLLYMTTQKHRTPKGLARLKTEVEYGRRIADKNYLLQLMTSLGEMYQAIWMESIWLIADASKSDTKFIISDHPITIYNSKCGPLSAWCRDCNDPDIRFHASHTVFPLSLEKILILTNLSWVRNPHQNGIGMRPNPNLLRDAVMSINEIQTLRNLSEEEVRQINFIIKNRAYRYIAAAKEEWLYPEKYVSKSDWANYGHGYLLMPDPRSVSFGGQIGIGYERGISLVLDEYGRQLGQVGFLDQPVSDYEWKTFLRFQGEYARLFGPYRRGRAFGFDKLDNERDSDDYHKYHLDLEGK